MPTIKGYQYSGDRNVPSDIQAEATQVQRDFEQELLPIRANTSLTDMGKRILIAAAYLPMQAEVARLQRDELDRFDKALSRTEADLFGKASVDAMGVVSTRDAFDRVERLWAEDEKVRPAKAKQLLDRATKTHDEALVRALVATAVERQWRDLLDHYRASNADLTGPIDDYLELREYDPATLMMAHYTFKLSTPSEIAGIPIARLQQIVDEGSSQRPADVYASTGAGVTVTDAQRAEYARMQAVGSRRL